MPLGGGGTSGSGGAGLLSKLFDSTLGANAASIDTGAAGIGQTAAHLRVLIVARTTEAVVLSSVSIVVNADGGANYDRDVVEVQNTAVVGGINLAGTSWLFNCAGASAQAGSFSVFVLDIPAYIQTTAHKAGVSQEILSDSVGANNRLSIRGLRWRNTAAITQLSVTAGSGSLLAGSRMTVYGLAVA